MSEMMPTNPDANDEHVLLNVQEAAAFLRLTRSTLDHYRCEGKGPMRRVTSVEGAEGDIEIRTRGDWVWPYCDIRAFPKVDRQAIAGPKFLGQVNGSRQRTVEHRANGSSFAGSEEKVLYRLKRARFVWPSAPHLA